MSGQGRDFVDGGFGNDRIDGGAGNDELWGLPGNDMIFGREGSDRLFGNEGTDLLAGGSGILDGGDGLDTAVLDGNRADFVVAPLQDGGRFAVTEVATGDTDVLFSVEFLAFADMTIPFDSII
jgi:Ca2+-binding RTX toxin-like protein